MLTVEEGGPQAEEMLENLVKDFEARHRGSENSGRIAALLGSVKFQQVSMSLEDAQWLGSSEFSAAQIASIFRVPPWVIGAKSGDSLTYSTVAEQMRAFVTFSLRPWLVSIEAALNADAELCPPGGALRAARVGRAAERRSQRPRVRLHRRVERNDRMDDPRRSAPARRPARRGGDDPCLTARRPASSSSARA